MNKKGQVADITIFVGVTIALIILAPVLIHLFTSITGGFSTALDNVDGSGKAGDAVTFAENKFTSAVDWVIMFMFLINIILLLITSFLVDIHPAFFIAYLIMVFFLIIFVPATMQAADGIWSKYGELGENAPQYLPMVEFMKDNFGMFVLAVLILSAIVMYSKYRMGVNNSGGTY